MAPDFLAAAVADDRRFKGVRPAAQRVQVGAGVGEGGGLVEPGPVADENLVGADHEGVLKGIRTPDAGRLESGEKEGRVRGRGALGLRGDLGGGLIHAGGPHLEAQAGIAEQGGAGAGLAREDKRGVEGLEHGQQLI